MSVTFANLHNVLVMRGVTKEGVKRTLRFWALRGLIRCEDSLDNSYEIISVRTFLHRVKALNDMLAKSSPEDDMGPDTELRLDMQRNVEKALEIANQAQIQGMPSDPTARRALARERSKTFYTGSSSPRAVL